MSGVAVDGIDDRLIAPRHDGARDGGRRDQRAGLALVHRAESVGVERRCRSIAIRRVCTRGLDIDRLAAHHPGRPGGRGDDGDRPQTTRGRYFSGRCRACEEAERFGQEAVARKDGECVAVHDMRRRPAAPERIVVHRGEIVVDQGIRVNQFDGAGDRQDRCARRRLIGGFVHGVAGGERQDGPEALAARHEAVAHGLRDARRAGRWHRQRGVERGVDFGPAGAKILGEIEGHGSSRAPAACSESGASRNSPRSVSTSIRRSASSRR